MMIEMKLRSNYYQYSRLFHGKRYNAAFHKFLVAFIEGNASKPAII